MGENIDDTTTDTNIMPYISMSNIACGLHAGNPITISNCVKEAKTHGVSIGVHPSYDDLEGFGRREIECSQEELAVLIHKQCSVLENICNTYDVSISYVKPHGALYNTMMKEMHIFETIVKAVASYDINLKLMILSNVNNEHYATLAQEHGITLLYEAFADRAYQDNGQLVPRSQDGAVLTSIKEILQRARLLQSEGYIESINSKKLTLKVDTLCVHGDTDHALEIIKALHQLNHEA